MPNNQELVIDHKEMTCLMVEAVTGMKRQRGVSVEEAYGRLYQHDVDQLFIEKIETGVARQMRYIHDQAIKANIGVA